MMDLSQHVTCKLKSLMSKCSYFSIALDQSIDVTDISQLIIFARLEDENFDVHEKLLSLYPLTGGQKVLIYMKHYTLLFPSLEDLQNVHA